MKFTLLILSLLVSACAPVGKGVSYSPTPATPSAGTTSTDPRFEVIVVDTNADSGVPRFTDARVTAIDRLGGAEDVLRVTIAWRGRGAGTFQIEGPAGTVLAEAVRLPGNKIWFRDVKDAKPFSEAMSRGLVFGESDPNRLKSATLEWLNRVVAPAIEPHLALALTRP